MVREPNGAPSPSRVRWAIVAILMTMTFANQFNRVAMAVAGDRRIMAEAGLTPVQMGQVYSAFVLAYTVFMTPGGWLIDRLGPRAALAGVGFGAAAFAALTGVLGRLALAPAALWLALIVVRAALGAASAPIF